MRDSLHFDLLHFRSGVSPAEDKGDRFRGAVAQRPASSHSAPISLARRYRAICNTRVKDDNKNDCERHVSHYVNLSECIEHPTGDVQPD